MVLGLIRGVKEYYHKEGIQGVWFYLKLRLYHGLIKGIKFADWHYFLNPERVMSKRFEQGFPLIDQQFTAFGNYYLSNSHKLNKQSVIYSLGVLNDTKFDEALVNGFGCNVFLFDPSIIATRHINKLNKPEFKFTEVAIWKEAGDVSFSTPLYGGSPSMVLEHSGRIFTAKAITLPQAMQMHGHSHIDLIKLDVEGAAPGIISHMLDAGIYPQQIVAEFERPKTGKAIDFFNFFCELQALNQRLLALGYQVWRLPRDKYCYFSVELIFIRVES
ncbi:MAG: hypothetical protein ACK4GU_09370 [Alishewanella aestuarii]